MVRVYICTLEGEILCQNSEIVSHHTGSKLFIYDIKYIYLKTTDIEILYKLFVSVYINDIIIVAQCTFFVTSVRFIQFFLVSISPGSTNSSNFT